MSKKKLALITGITGQDGSYLAEFLLSRDYEVHGIVRRAAFVDPKKRVSRIEHILDKITLHSASLESYGSLHNVVEEVRPQELYHLAAQTFVATSFEDEHSTMETNVHGTHHILTAVKRLVPECKVYFAGSSEMFGKVNSSPQNEDTPFHPRSTYGISKVAGFHLMHYYREAWKIFACSGILFNHESPRRGMEFVTRKITHTAAMIKHGYANELRLGNLDAKRDWGYAPEYVRAMWLMLQQDNPDDFVIATGKQHSVREFVSLAFDSVGLNFEDYVVVDPAFFRPAEVYELCGDASKAQKVLGWKHQKPFDWLVEEMVEYDVQHCEPPDLDTP